MGKNNETLNSRSSQWTIVLNDNELHLLKSSQNIVRKIMCDEKQIIFVACIYHARDKREDDTESLKTPHYHVVLQFGGMNRKGTIINWLTNLFGINENQIQIDKCNSIEMQTRYLTHLDDFDKEPYDYWDIEVPKNMRATLDRYYHLQIVRDLSDLVNVVKHYHYELEVIMTTISHYDKWRKYIIDLINDHRRRF